MTTYSQKTFIEDGKEVHEVIIINKFIFKNTTILKHTRDIIYPFNDHQKTYGQSSYFVNEQPVTFWNIQLNENLIPIGVEIIPL